MVHRLSIDQHMKHARELSRNEDRNETPIDIDGLDGCGMQPYLTGIMHE